MTHTWLIRIYAVIILALVWLNFLEDTAYDLTVTSAAVLIIIQSFAKDRCKIE